MTDKTDSEFEAWALREFGMTPAQLIKDAETGYYANYPTQCYLDVWRASRAEMVIQLTGITIIEHNGCDFYEKAGLCTAIEAAGAKWRE